MGEGVEERWVGEGGGTPNGYFHEISSMYLYGFPILIDFLAGGVLDWDLGGCRRKMRERRGTPEGHFHQISSMYLLRYACFDFFRINRQSP